MKNFEVKRIFPPGFDYGGEKKFFLYGSCGSAVISLLTFFPGYISELREAARSLEVSPNIPVKIPDFCTIADNAFLGFSILGICMLFFPLLHLFYHYSGSKSIYLMRRLPRRGELARRCLAFPLASAAACFIGAAVLMLLYFGVYYFCTPQQLLPNELWTKLWEVFI